MYSTTTVNPIKDSRRGVTIFSGCKKHPRAFSKAKGVIFKNDEQPRAKNASVLQDKITK